MGYGKTDENGSTTVDAVVHTPGRKKRPPQAEQNALPQDLTSNKCLHQASVKDNRSRSSYIGICPFIVDLCKIVTYFFAILEIMTVYSECTARHTFRRKGNARTA